MNVWKRNGGQQGRRRMGIDPSLAILVVIGLIVAGATLPIANSPDSVALCVRAAFFLCFPVRYCSLSASLD